MHVSSYVNGVDLDSSAPATTGSTAYGRYGIYGPFLHSADQGPHSPATSAAPSRLLVPNGVSARVCHETIVDERRSDTPAVMVFKIPAVVPAELGAEGVLARKRRADHTLSRWAPRICVQVVADVRRASGLRRSV